MILPRDPGFQRWARVVQRFLVDRSCRTGELSPELLRLSIARLEPGLAVCGGARSAAEEELVSVHRIEQARLFFEAVRIALAHRENGDSLLGPALIERELADWRRSTLAELRLALLDGADAPLGLVIGLVWTPNAWATPENLVLAGLGLRSSFDGRVTHAGALLARGDDRSVRDILARLEPSIEEPHADYWITSGACHEQRDELHPALCCFLRAARDPRTRGEWARGIAMGLALALGRHRDVDTGMKLAGRSREWRIDVRDDATDRIRARWSRWVMVAPPMPARREQCIVDMLHGPDALARAIARAVLCLVPSAHAVVDPPSLGWC